MLTPPPDTAQLQLCWNQFWAYAAWWLEQPGRWIWPIVACIVWVAQGGISRAIDRSETKRIIQEELKKHERP